MPADAKKKLNELDDPSGVAPATAPRPTVVPPFDTAQYAEQSEVRERMPTLTDEGALEEARLQSFRTNAPPPPFGPNVHDSSVEIDTGEADVDALDDDEQVALFTERLAPLTRVPTLAQEMQKLGPLLEDPKTAFVLGFVDGILPLDTIIDVTGLPELDTLRILDRMVAQGVVVFRARS